MPLTIAIECPRQDGVVRLLDMSNAYAESLYPAESNHMLDLASLEKSGVTFWVARIAGDIVGCCALVEAGDGTAEIKRMFVDPVARGRSVARKLMETLEAAAAERNLRAVRLETGISAGSDRPLQKVRLSRDCRLRQLPARSAEPVHGKTTDERVSVELTRQNRLEHAAAIPAPAHAVPRSIPPRESIRAKWRR